MKNRSIRESKIISRRYLNALRDSRILRPSKIAHLGAYTDLRRRRRCGLQKTTRNLTGCLSCSFNIPSSTPPCTSATDSFPPVAFIAVHIIALHGHMCGATQRRRLHAYSRIHVGVSTYRHDRPLRAAVNKRWLSDNVVALGTYHSACNILITNN